MVKGTTDLILVALWVLTIDQKKVIVVACLYGGAGNDPEALGIAFHHQGSTFINVYCSYCTIYG